MVEALDIATQSPPVVATSKPTCGGHTSKTINNNMEDEYKPNKILILSGYNYEKWFAITRAKLQGKGGNHVLNYTLKDKDKIPAGTTEADFSKLDGIAKEQILTGIDMTDYNLIATLDTAKEQWEKLQSKYTDNRRLVIANKQKELVNYKKQEEHTVQDAWAAIHKLANEIISVKPNLKPSYADEELLYILYDSLPSGYATTVDTLKARDEKDAMKVLRVLEDHEDTLKSRELETGLIARRAPFNRQKSGLSEKSEKSHRSESTRSKHSSTRFQRPTSPKPPKCYLCDELGHRIEQCDAFEPVKDLVRQLRKSKKKQVRFAKKEKAYQAGEEISSSSSQDDSIGEEEIAHITYEAARKLIQIDRHVWALDTAASSCMTDEIHRFRGPLRSIKRRTIKVGGGVLYADHVGTISIKSREGVTVMISCVLFVPNLGASLLACRKLCHTLGLKGKFDSESMFLHTINGNKSVLKGVHFQGIYRLEWISGKFPKAKMTTTQPLIERATIANEQIQPNTEIQQPLEQPLKQPLQQQLPDGTSEDHQSTKDYFLMHRRFAHFGTGLINKLHKVTTHTKINTPKTSKICSSCAVGKMKKEINRTVVPRKEGILDLVSVDVCGPLPKSYDGNIYFLNIVDNCSRYTWTICTKDRKSIPSHLDVWKKSEELKTERKVKSIRLDNAKELLSIVNKWVKESGITLQDTEPYTSHQNGIAERSIQTTEQCTRSMLHEADLPVEFWDEAAKTCTYLKNLVPTTTNDDIRSPTQIYTGKTPSIDHIRVWGCKCYAFVNPDSHPPGTRQDKLMPKAREAVLMGFDPETTSQYRIYAPDLGRCIKSSSVTFEEDTKGGALRLKLNSYTPNWLPLRKSASRQQLFLPYSKTVEQGATPVMSTEQGELKAPVVTLSPAISSTQSLQAPPSRLPFVPIPPPPILKVPALQPPALQPIPEPVNSASTPAVDPPALQPTPEPVKSTTTPSVNPPAPERPSRTATWLPALKRKRDNEISDDIRLPKHIKALMAMKAVEDVDEQGYVPVPESYTEAIEHPVYGSKWSEAMNNELSQLAANNTWIPEIPPPEANIVTSKWVFTVKYNQDGSVNKFKARLCARGFSQIQGIDYDETFAPTVRMDTMRAVLALIAIKDLETGQIDVNNAFTESTLEHLIYMQPPPGLDVKQGEYLRLLQSLYGLKQAAHDWYFTCNRELVRLGFRSSDSDPCMYINKERQLIVLVYVDDILSASPNTEPIKWFKREFAKVFKIKDLGELQKILGVEVIRDRANRKITLNQKTYIQKVLKGFDMEQDTYRTTDIPLNGYSYISPAHPNEAKVDRTDYQRATGHLMHAMVYTRPDIAFALGKLSQFMSDPAERHAAGMKHLIRYLRSHADLSIVYNGNESSTIRLVGYSDADYASDKTDRKSTMGQIFMLAGGPISWASRKQRSVSTSTTEAEYMALSECSRQAVWFTHLFTELGYPEIVSPTSNQISINISENPEVTMELKGDNNGAISLVKNRQISERSKHIDVAYHYIRELQQSKRVDVGYVPTDEMRADGLTKPLAKQKFQLFINLIGMKSDSRGSRARAK